MNKVVRFFLLIFALLGGIIPAFGGSSSAHFYAEKTSDTPTGAGRIYVVRGGETDMLALSISDSQWKSSDSQFDAGKIDVDDDNAPDGYKKYDKDNSKKTIGVLNMYFYAIPNTGYQFDGWYSAASGGTLLTGSTEHYPGEIYGSYTTKVNKTKTQTYTSERWNNGTPGNTPAGAGEWEGFYYMRHVEEVKNGDNKNITKYVKFSVKPRDIILGGTGFDDVTYTATGIVGSVGKTTQTLSGTSSDVALALAYDSEKYTFEGWLWAEGGFTGGDTISKAASYTYPLTTTYVAYGMTSSNKVHIWPVVKRKIVPVAEVTHNAVTTPYETWEEAIAAAKAVGVSGATITLFKDVSGIASAQEIDRDITLDLNGHTFAGTANYLFTVTGSGTDFTICNGSVAEGQISFSTSTEQYSYAIGVQSGAKLILQSGKIYSNNTKSDGSGRCVEIQSGATLEMTGGVIEAQSLQSAYALINRGTATISGGDIYSHTTSAATAVGFYNVGTSASITGGTFRAYAATTTAYGINQNVNNTLTISNAIVRAEAVTSTAYALARSNGVMVVNSGKYNAVAPSTVAAVNVTNKAQITLQGGIYRTNTSIANCCASGYGCYELVRGEDWNAGYRYEVLPTSQARNFRVVADGTSTYYTSFADVNTFINASSSPIIQVFLIVPEYTIPAGNYTLPPQADLIVPNASDITGAILQPATTANTKSTPSLFRRLNFASGVNLTANGNICVCGNMAAIQGAQITGIVTGPYGRLHLNENSHIQLGSSSTLYAWGYISGTGTIDAPSGSTVWEAFQFDWRGGGHVSDVYSTVFPVNQYYIQNIEASLTLHGGAVEKLFTALYVPTFSKKVETDATFVGNDGMFKLESGSTLTKHYDNTNDRQIFDINGNCTLQNVALTLNTGLADVSIDSKDYELPFTNNMTVNIHSGTATIKYDVDILADTKIVVDAGATVSLLKNVFVYDKDDWAYNITGGTNTTGYFAISGDVTRVPYTVASRGARNTSTMQDGTIVVNGTLRTESSSGYLYTTSKGANICSDGGGVIILTNGVGTKTSIKQQVNAASKTADVPVGPAQLYNADGSYTATAGSAVGTTVYYKNGHWGWVGTWKDYDGTVIKVAKTCTESQLAGQAPSNPTRPEDECGTYSFNSWSSSRDATKQEIVYTATYTSTAKTYSVTYAAGANGSGTVAAGTKTCGEDFTLSSSTFTRVGYTQTGWSTEDGGAKAYNLGGTYTTNAAITLYPFWTINQYTILWKNEDGSSTIETDENQTYGSATVYNGATPTKAATEEYAYTFDGWATSAGGAKVYDNGSTPTATGDAIYYAHFTTSERFYGNKLDIVDWTNEYIVINANGLKAVSGGTGWTIQIGENSYTKSNREADRSLKIARGTNSPNDEVIIKFRGTSGVESRQKYRVPYIVTTDKTLSSLSPAPTTNSVVYVKTGATLTVSADATIAKLYVSPGANVNITSGTLTVTDTLVLRTLPWQTAAISGSFSAGHTYYTRIGPNNSTINGLNGTATYAAASYYQFAIPFDCNIADVRLSDGTIPAYETTWALKEYSEYNRATYGSEANNWVFVTNTGANIKIKACTGYEFFSSGAYYREYYFPVTPPATETSVAVARTGNDDANSGWNMICSPLMSRHMNTPKPEDAVFCWLNENDEYDQMIPDFTHPAMPFFYQAAAAGELSFDGAAEPSLAPRRVVASEEQTRIQWIHLDVTDANGIGDQTSIYSHPTRYEEAYQTGIDVAKQSLTASRAIIYSTHAYGDMAFAGVSDALLEQGVALTVYNPSEQELTISMRENNWLNRMAYVWLIDNETGAQINLLDEDYTIAVPAGTTSGRFIIKGVFKAPAVTTEIEPTSDSSLKGREVQKLLIDQKMYIRINGVLYDATGKLVNHKW